MEAFADLLALALAFHRSPLRYQALLRTQMELPEGAEILLRIAGGDTRLAQTYCRTTGTDIGELIKAAEFFIEQVFFAPRATHYRILGLSPTATGEQVKEHYRLLMHLFHPDRYTLQGTWADVHARRVNQAYNMLRKPERRRHYDAMLKSAQPVCWEAPADTTARQTQRKRVTLPMFRIQQSMLANKHSASFLRRHLPQWVLAAVALLAIGFVWLAYLTNQPFTSLVDPTAKDEAADSALPETAQSIILSSYPNVHENIPASRSNDAPLGSQESLVVPQERPVVTRLNAVAVDALRTEERLPNPGVVVSAPPVKPLDRKPEAGAESLLALKLEPTPLADLPLSDKALLQAVSPAAVKVVLGRFIGAYERGDVTTLMALFTERARANTEVGKADIARNYQKVFQATQTRRLILSNLYWHREGTILRGKGDFSVKVQGWEERYPKIYSGTIRFELEKQNGELLIREVQHFTDRTAGKASIP